MARVTNTNNASAYVESEEQVQGMSSCDAAWGDDKHLPVPGADGKPSSSLSR